MGMNERAGQGSSPIAPEQKRSIERKGQLLDAAVSLLVSSGSAGVTHRRVADASNSSPGAVRYYFRTREDLLVECLNSLEEARSAQAERVLDEVSAGKQSPEQTASWALSVYYGADTADDTVTGMLATYLDCSREGSRLAQLLAEQRQASHDQLRVLLRRCGFSNVAPSLVTAVLDGSVLASTIEGHRGAAASAVEELAGILRQTTRE
ncbi:TetR/AcrR family transcriptional regulator [Gulosibacter molinativorax]|uniref:TetR/AcrR family transcriptional regulator n=1 Tax=Gulosibacter molinativorax TaxID=256821 RepID=A0ABT7C6T1_9MICO|nr:TetR/AcrR family transcriptional regulator [Gulosibacter molinativorax]MDJ1370813.1 TetR/AcrR family transcriptional regulator [Gulosibacter molinativorax]QUY62149.1 Hypotetical protein [Gulosibacter molinativorax]